MSFISLLLSLSASLPDLHALFTWLWKEFHTQLHTNSLLRRWRGQLTFIANQKIDETRFISDSYWNIHFWPRTKLWSVLLSLLLASFFYYICGRFICAHFGNIYDKTTKVTDLLWNYIDRLFSFLLLRILRIASIFQVIVGFFPWHCFKSLWAIS